MDKIKPQSEFVKQNEILLRENGEWLYFSNPRQVIIANKLEDVMPALEEIEHLISTTDCYAAGFLSYEAAPAFDSALQTKPGTGFPYLWFGLYPKPQNITLPKPDPQKEVLRWHPTIVQETYEAAIAKIKAAIAEGKTYQVNYTMRLEADYTGDVWQLFLHLVQNQNNHAAYLNTGRYAICSASPELFFEIDGTTITCRPMKGTTKRGRTTLEDHEQSEWLRHSAKNRAENVMIVDMIRNDLGKIAQIGSVSVDQLFEIERYPTLWQMTSTVTAKTHASFIDIFKALFPSASITGAPRVSTMRFIKALEGTPRNIYTGTIGYISPHRKASFNVAIRTALVDLETQKAEYGVGGGVVWDSDSADEYAEALLKAQVLVQRPRPFSLLETVLWTPTQGFFLQEKHIARMLDSALYFDIPITREKVEAYLKKISAGFRAPQRIRLLLDQSGGLNCEIHAAEMTKAVSALKVALAKEPVESSNVFLFHKTTRREVYESAREGFEKLNDVLLYNEFGESTEFTIGNLVVELNGQLLTPPISCGVLAGTFRAHLVETGQILERTIPVDQLKNCTKLFRVNSIRKWQKVILQNRSS